MATPIIRNEGVVYLRDSKEREPMSVVWTSLPLISALVPVIGHAGITDSTGVTFDFSGPYQVTVYSLMGGPAKRVWPLDPDRMHKLDDKSLEQSYDGAVVKAACAYGKRMHNIFCQNCHHHVAMVLNEVRYDGRDDWNQFHVFWSIWRHGHWASRSSCLSAFTPSIIILIFAAGLVCFLIFRTK